MRKNFVAVVFVLTVWFLELCFAESPVVPPAADWKAAVGNDLLLAGKISSQNELQRFQNADLLPEGWFLCEFGDLAIILALTDDKEKGNVLRLLSLVDKQTSTVLSSRNPMPLFTAEVFDKETGKKVALNSDDGWGKIYRDTDGSFFLSGPKKLPGAEGLEIRLRLSNDDDSFPLQKNGFQWTWSIVRAVDRYEFRWVTCPQISLRNLGPTMKVFYPQASGVVKENPCSGRLRWHGIFANEGCSMQWTAVYDETKNVGLYIATHHSGGSVKSIRIETDLASETLTIRYEYPLPLTHTANPSVSGLWCTFRGDWYDAALIYRNFVRNFAEWYPRQKLGPEGRTDTPLWMKEHCAWVRSGESPQKLPALMRRVTDALGVPTAVHWYNWHKIRFDNDYPHYFPAKDGFKEAVAEIQKNGDIYVMPYINGRLWDTRDKGAEDFQFTTIALPATTKKEDGKPYIETYGNNKEPDGSAVELAVMCPATDVWKNKVAEIIFRLFNEYGVAGVYVDQVSAANPILCYDHSHGHPLAGGDWWNREYWKMFENIRNEMPKDRILTSECNAEPHTGIFDGFLALTFQCQGQVPAFAAVYGGVVQMFCRALHDGPTQVMADRMKAAQQLVFGEQIGRIDPVIIDDPVRLPFIRSIVQMRHKYRDYFYKGEMLRPPKLLDEIPTVTANWRQTPREAIMTTDTVLTGAWRKADANSNTVSAVFFFVNVSDKPITSRVAVRLDEVGLKSNAFDRPLTFAPDVPLVIEVFSGN